MTVAAENTAAYALKLARSARAAGRELADTAGAVRDRALTAIAAALDNSFDAVHAANQLDLADGRDAGLAEPVLDRLAVTAKRLAAMAEGVRQIAAQPDPVGEIIEGRRRPNGLEINKVRVPFGVVLTIYESRPNVTVDVAALCLKSGNACILRGGKEALRTNAALARVVAAALADSGLPAAAVQMVESSDREIVGHLLKQDENIDVVIPRGGESLIRRVAEESRIPVIKHYRGNCHVYVDLAADFDAARRIVVNSKLQRVAVCNAAETLLVHGAIASALLPLLVEDLTKGGCELRGCEKTRMLCPQVKAATEDDWYEEYLAPIMAVKVVGSADEAIDHVNKYGSHHTDAIVTTDLPSARRFAARVDSASVIINASTRFADGYEFGLGAEVGISTDKLHARGPMGAADLCTYKWVVTGDGHCRE